MKEQCSEAPLQKHRRELLLSKLTNGKKQMVKMYYLPFLFIEYLEFSKIHCNLFNFEIQIILVKVGFYFLLSISFEKMAFNGFFGVCLGKYWVMAMIESIFVFFELRVKVKKY